MEERLFKGFNGNLILNDSGVKITRGGKGFVTQRTNRDDKFIPWENIVAVQYRKASFLGGVGYIHLSLRGGSEAEVGLMQAIQDENTVTWANINPGKKNKEFSEAYNIILDKISSNSKTCPSCAEEVKTAERRSVEGNMSDSNQKGDQESSSTKDQIGSQESPWWNQNWVAIVALIIFYPLGLFLTWRSPHISKQLKIILTIVFGFLFITALSNKSDKPDNSLQTKSNVTNTTQSNDTSPQEKAKSSPYTAIISCLHLGAPYFVDACFHGGMHSRLTTNIALKIDGRNRIYQPAQFDELGVRKGQDLYVALPKHFELRTQNAAEHFILRVIIKDEDGDVVFEDQAAQYQSINVRN